MVPNTKTNSGRLVTGRTLGMFKTPRALLGVGTAILWTAILIANQPADRRGAIGPGSRESAEQYYARISAELEFASLGFSAEPAQTTIDSLLQFIGYSIAVSVIEAAEPDALMNPSRFGSLAGLPPNDIFVGGGTLRDGDILATRFFAPKIVNVDAEQRVPGWRKLVRLRTRPDAKAARSGILSTVILFNYLVSVGEGPFRGPSVNTQVMLIAPSKPDRLYWLDFSANGKLSLALNASFDAKDLGGNRDYFVPDGCNNCHGSPGNSAVPMINYLDTDNWFDRLDDDKPEPIAA